MTAKPGESCKLFLGFEKVEESKNMFFRPVLGFEEKKVEECF